MSDMPPAAMSVATAIPPVVPATRATTDNGLCSPT